jgi:hypothetical protein
VAGDYDFGLWPWLRQTHYPLRRAQSLAEVHKGLTGSVIDGILRDLSLKGFIKREWLIMFKTPRGIHPESEAMKVRMGPIFKAIENVVYQLRWFVKHMPVQERPAFILDNVDREGWIKIFTDFSSFEAGFNPLVQQSIEFPMYFHMLRNCPQQLAIMKAYSKICCGVRHVAYQDVKCDVRARRMSGQMCTSLGNTWTNFVLMTFMMKDHLDLHKMRLAVEGDDGVCAVPPEAAPAFNAKMFERAGFKVKVQQTKNIEEGSFCGCVFDRHDRVNVSDPLRILATFGWVEGQNVFADDVRMQVIGRAKSMSLAYTFYRAPILHELAKYGLRMTQRVKLEEVGKWIAQTPTLNEWSRDRYLEVMKHRLDMDVGVPWRTRKLVADKYGFSVGAQIDFERYLSHKNDLGPLLIPSVEVPSDWAYCAQNFVRFFQGGTTWYDVEHLRGFVPVR